jgi:transposase
MMPPENKPVSELAKENGISEQTLYTWRRNLKSQGVPVPGNGKNTVEWSSADKFGVMLETARMNEQSLILPQQRPVRCAGCRLARGLPASQCSAWRAQPGISRAKQSDRKEIKQLKKDLQRKDKALAEAAALIMLLRESLALLSAQFSRPHNNGSMSKLTKLRPAKGRFL